jgi:Siphovirus Gp157
MPAAAKKAHVVDARRDMHKELAAAAALKHQLAEAFGEEQDLALLRDMVEGETNLDSAIDKVLEQMAMDVANIQGLEKFESTMAARRKRLSDRVETMRSMLLNAMDILEERRIERPVALLTMKAAPPKLLITDEAAIPTSFFKQPDPVLSKKDLADALKDRRDTLEQKLAELREKQIAGEIDDDKATEATERLIAAFPPIPGAELDNGGASIQIRWS